ncbi:hypothetical protein SG34_006305 [Thalassomonas viridans]|uniref:Uncharacterized protein n=1 Tax=Thalassomonas viridans TaxID=137584 RepID=A0AAE9Z4M5_9GAMM|nr:hypothetical protein [Thalassomonas viridans]WDE06528.1 hypothetical protein SG34_006305 [Thalassomonas viridans]
MSYLLNRSAPGLPASELSEILDRLIWYMDDNGGEIEDVRNKWLASDDKRKVEVALGMSDTFPFDTRDKLKACFDRIINEWPDLDADCQKILETWDKQFK